MTFISKINIGKMKHSTEMCYVNGNLVVHFAGATANTIRVLHEKSGRVLQEWNRCHARPHLMMFKIYEKEYLLEGCRHCRVIRGYESPERSSGYKIFYEDITPDTMCKGPNNKVLVLEGKSIKQLGFSCGHFNLAEQFSYELENVFNMCYCEKYGTIIVLHGNQKSLTGVMLTTGEVVWKHTNITLGSPANVLDRFKSLFTIPNGRICIFNLGKLFVLDPKYGAIKYELFNQDQGINWSIATRNNGFQQRFAIQHGHPKQISVFDLLLQRCLPLQNIISEEENGDGGIRLNTPI